VLDPPALGKRVGDAAVGGGGRRMRAERQMKTKIRRRQCRIGRGGGIKSPSGGTRARKTFVSWMIGFISRVRPNFKRKTVSGDHLVLSNAEDG
jgi:hypothetical protein